jgi:hypothetical protein
MKTLQDCKDRMVRSMGITWLDYTKNYHPYSISLMTDQAAELYGRYCRLVSRWQMRQEIDEVERKRTRLLMKISAIRAYAKKPTMTIELLREKIKGIVNNIEE